MSDKKRPLILLSGGIDSTYLAQLAVSEHTGFDRLYIEGGQGLAKIDAESRAITKIVEILDKKLETWTGSDLNYCRAYSVPFGFPGFDLRTLNTLGFSQAMMWFFGAMMAVDGNRHSSVQIGYITGDQIAPAINHLKETWKTIWSIFKHPDQKFVPLEFPLIDNYRTKMYVLDNISEDLYEQTWVCELPIVRFQDFKKHLLECGKCAGCVNRIVELQRHELTTGRTRLPRTVHDILKEQALAEGWDMYPPDRAEESAKISEIEEI